MEAIKIKYSVKDFRAAGLEAKWTKTRRQKPIIVVRNPQAKAKHQRDKWWVCDRSMFESMQEHGIVEGFDCCTLLGDLFAI